MSDPDSTSELRDGRTEILVRAAKNGREAAWNAVFQRFERMLLGHVKAMAGGDRAMVGYQDIVQATFTIAWREIQAFEFRGEGSFRRWLISIARGQYLNARKSEEARPAVQAESGVLERRTCEKTAEDQLSRPERMSLYEAMGKVEEDDREILLMYSDEGLKFAQIAEVLEISETTAKLRVQQAMKRLRVLVDGHGGGPA